MASTENASLADTQRVVTGCARQRATFFERSLEKRPHHNPHESCFFEQEDRGDREEADYAIFLPGLPGLPVQT
jgi:hypothetical protein